MVMTCVKCNSGTGGAALDVHAVNEGSVVGFLAGTSPETKVELRTETGILPARMQVGDGTIKMVGVPAAAHPEWVSGFHRDFEQVFSQSWEWFTFHATFPAYSPKRAAVSWLRSAYLCVFATLGYRAILHAGLNVGTLKPRS